MKKRNFFGRVPAEKHKPTTTALDDYKCSRRSARKINNDAIVTQLHDTLRGMFQSWFLSYGNVSGIHGYLLKPNIHLVAMANENFVYPSPRMTPPCRV